MHARLTGDLETYAVEAEPFLLRDPVVHNVLLTVVATLRAGFTFGRGAPAFALVHDAGVVVGAASRTPPHPVLLSAMPPAAVDALAAAWPDADVAGVTGPASEAARFAERWHERTARTSRRVMAQRVHRLDAVIAPAPVPGTLRLAAPAEVDVLAGWARSFTTEVGVAPTDERRTVQHHVGRGWMWVWDLEGTPVSSARRTADVGGIVRVGFVYTPPHLRRRGYASACVAAASEAILRGGAVACMLYADLANPTSNAIYQRLGYRPVSDAAEYRFDD